MLKGAILHGALQVNRQAAAEHTADERVAEGGAADASGETPHANSDSTQVLNYSFRVRCYSGLIE